MPAQKRSILTFKPQFFKNELVTFWIIWLFILWNCFISDYLYYENFFILNLLKNRIIAIFARQIKYARKKRSKLWWLYYFSITILALFYFYPLQLNQLIILIINQKFQILSAIFGFTNILNLYQQSFDSFSYSNFINSLLIHFHIKTLSTVFWYILIFKLY